MNPLDSLGDICLTPQLLSWHSQAPWLRSIVPVGLSIMAAPYSNRISMEGFYT